MGQNTIVGHEYGFGQLFVFFVNLYPFISSCSRVFLICCRILFTFCWFSIMFWFGFSGWFYQVLLDLVEFGRLAFRFVVFWRFLFVSVAFGLTSVNSSRGFPLFFVSSEFVADFVQVLSDLLSIFPYLYDCRRFR